MDCLYIKKGVTYYFVITSPIITHPNQSTVYYEENTFTTNFLLLKSRYGVVLEMAFNLCATFSQMLSLCDWKVNLLSKNTPNNFSRVL